LIDGQDRTWEIRTSSVNQNVSQVSAYPGVRAAMTQQQRKIAGRGKIVMLGRDIGTVVLPNADLKSIWTLRLKYGHSAVMPKKWHSVMTSA